MERIICLAVGYLFGLFQTGFLYSRSQHVDIRKEGSGNVGSTNVLRVMGVKAGAIVLLGDCLKCILACLAARLLFAGKPDMVILLVIYAAFGAMLGHNFPFYMGFKGGKGIACTAGMMMSIDWKLTLVCFLVFVTIVFVTRYVSLGSLVVEVIFVGWMAYFGARGWYGLGSSYYMECVLVSGLVAAMAFIRHRANIARLLAGTENKIGSGKKKA